MGPFTATIWLPRKLKSPIFVIFAFAFGMIFFRETVPKTGIIHRHAQGSKFADSTNLALFGLDRHRSSWTLQQYTLQSSEFNHYGRGVRKQKRQASVVINGTCVVEDGIFWSQEVERMIPTGIDDLQVQSHSALLRQAIIEDMSDQGIGGKGSNSLLYTKRGEKIFARKRSKCYANAEILTFYLSRMLGMDNVPVAVLSHPNPYTEQWNSRKVRMRITDKEWFFNDDISMSLWMNFSENVSFPRILLQNERKLHSNNALLPDMTLQEIVEIAQWSDMVVLDFLILHVDRVTRALRTTDAALKDPWVLDVKIKNLGRRGRKLWLFDNEAAISFVAHLQVPDIDIAYHTRLLNSTCIFRRSTVEQLLWLHHTGSVESLLKAIVLENEPVLEWDSVLSCRRHLLVTSLQERIGLIYQHVISCLAEL